MEEDESIQRALRHVVLLKVDAGSAEQRALADSHGVRLFPTFAMTNAGGEVLSRWIGYGDAEEWIANVSATKDDPVTEAERTARHETEPNFRDALALGQYALAAGAYADAESYYRDALRLDASKAEKADVPILIFRAAYYGAGAEQIPVDHAARVASGLLQQPKLKPEYAFEITERMVRAADRIGVAGVVPHLRMAYPHLADLTAAEYQQRQNDFFINYALFVEKNTTQALRLKRVGMPEGWKEDPDELNSFAWWCFENELNLDEAEELAARGAQLAASDATRANILDTQAEIVHALGRTQEAFELIARAVELNPQSEYLQRQHERFRGLVNGTAEQVP